MKELSMKLLQFTRWRILSTIKRYPRIYLPLVKQFRSAGRELAVSKNTDILIEAYPRSANTFATIAFRLAQPEPVKIAHHLHAVAQVLGAVRQNTPALVLIRNPRDAVLSHVARSRNYSLSLALQDYEIFYKSLESCRDGFVLAKFETVTHDFGSVIKKVNQRFNQDFGVFEHTPENEKLIFEEVKKIANQNSRSITSAASMPAEGREEAKAKHSGKLELPRNQQLLEAAMKIYESMSKNADI